MSVSEVVDLEYRLNPDDLHNTVQRVAISNVSYQGLEDLNPVLHFEGRLKRMVLSQAQVWNLVQITGSVIFTDWIGHVVVLNPRNNEKAEEIRIQATVDKDGWFRANVRRHDINVDGWILALLIVLSLSIVSLAYVWQNGDDLWETVLTLLG